MPRIRASCVSTILALLVAVSFCATISRAKQDASSGEAPFSAAPADERAAGVWVDGKYAGYVREFKFRGRKKLLLPPGEHEITIKQGGYEDLTKTVALVAGQFQD